MLILNVTYNGLAGNCVVFRFLIMTYHMFCKDFSP